MDEASDRSYEASQGIIGRHGRIRTDTEVNPLEPKSSAATSYATRPLIPISGIYVFGGYRSAATLSSPANYGAAVFSYIDDGGA